MKLELKQWTETAVDGSQHPLSTKELLRICLNVAPVQGYNPSEMRRRIKFLDRVEALPEDATEIEFSAEELKTMKECVKLSTWRVASREIMAFIDLFDPENAAVAAPVEQ